MLAATLVSEYVSVSLRPIFIRTQNKNAFHVVTIASRIRVC